MVGKNLHTFGDHSQVFCVSVAAVGEERRHRRNMVGGGKGVDYTGEIKHVSLLYY